MSMYDSPIVFRDAALILTEGTNDGITSVIHVLEDANSPITKKYREKLYQNIIDRSHVDFGDIPKSRGDITKYSGYKTMTETLNVLIALAKEEKCKELIKYATTVITSIENIKKAKQVYVKGFSKKENYIILDYNLYVYTCVQSTTSLISGFINDIKTPSSQMKIELTNDKYKANLFYIESLEKFNKVCENGNYIKYINTVLEGGTEHLFGIDDSVLIGAGAIAAIALSIIPLTRKLIYYYKELRRKLSETLATQAYFLELNKNCVEYNSTIDSNKKKKILQRQEKIRKLMLSLSDRLKIADAKAEQNSQRELKKDNQTMTMDGIRDEISDSDIEIL